MVTVGLLVNVLVCLVLVVRARTARERLLGVILAGTTAAAVLAVLSVLLQIPALRDAGLVVVALAAMIAISRVGAETA